MSQPESVTERNELKYLWQEKRWWSVGTTGAALIFAAIFIRQAFQVLVFPLMAVGYWFYYAQTALRKRLMQQYAQLRGYTYADDLSDYQPRGAIFGRGHDQKIYDTVSGVLAGSRQFYLYLYEFTVGSGRSSHTYYATAVSLVLPESGPHLYLASKNGSLRSMISGSEIAQTFQSSKQYQLEGDFDRYYQLYGENGDEVNLLEVVNPATMQQLLAIQKYDIELIGNLLNLYRSGEADSAAELDTALATAQQLITSFGPIMQRMDVGAPALPVQPTV